MKESNKSILLITMNTKSISLGIVGKKNNAFSFNNSTSLKLIFGLTKMNTITTVGNFKKQLWAKFTKLKFSKTYGLESFLSNSP